ncbi:MAG TPA: hypothetical protein VJK25_03120 [Patescibacteria group bacterium]|nr:hypothetical protein [Patescibacteria group bacterium]
MVDNIFNSSKSKKEEENENNYFPEHNRSLDYVLWDAALYHRLDGGERLVCRRRHNRVIISPGQADSVGQGCSRNLFRCNVGNLRRDYLGYDFHHPKSRRKLNLSTYKLDSAEAFIQLFLFQKSPANK